MRVGEGRDHEAFVGSDFNAVAMGSASCADSNPLLPGHRVLGKVAPHLPDLTAW